MALQLPSDVLKYKISAFNKMAIIIILLSFVVSTVIVHGEIRIPNRSFEHTRGNIY